MSVSYRLIAAELNSDPSRTVRRRRHFYVLRRANRNRATQDERKARWKKGMSADGGTAGPAWHDRWMTGSGRQPQQNGTFNEKRRDTERRTGMFVFDSGLCLVNVNAALWTAQLFTSRPVLLVISKGRIPFPPDLFPSRVEIFSFALLLLRVKINKAQRALVSVSIWLPYMC